ncbi:MAG: hypothetical protein RBT80_12695 [Candidatus Vecturithrix sp.]|jgi:hypothetical protein|nr:hypothetical protein [Candidatus Vecturithrix sp.]
MNLHDMVFVINPQDKYYGQKFLIEGIQTDFYGRITSYTVRTAKGYRDYAVTDVQYAPHQQCTCTPQMQLL